MRAPRQARARYEVGAEGPSRFDVAYDEGGAERAAAGDRVRPSRRRTTRPRRRTTPARDAPAGPARALAPAPRRRGGTRARGDDARPAARARCAVLLDGGGAAAP